MNPKDLIRTAELAATSYVDTTEQWGHLSQVLSELTEAIRNHYQLPVGTGLTVEQETEFFAYNNKNALTVDGLLNTAIKANHNFVHKLLGGDVGANLQATLLDICIVSAEVPFLPPKEQEVQTGDGESEWQETRFDETRLAKVFDFLRTNEIKLDQIILRPGTLDEKKMRKRPYFLVEVLPWNIQIGVCSQVGNALFVTPKILSVYEWATNDKETLVERLGAKKVSMAEGWQERLQQTVNRFLTIDPPKTLSVPDIRARQNTARGSKVPFTKEMRDELLAERRRTGLGGQEILSRIQNPSPGLSHFIIANWTVKNVDGSWHLQNIRPDWFLQVITTYKAQPDVFLLDQNKRRSKLISERKRTGLGGKSIINLLKDSEDLPEGLTGPMIDSWSAIKQGEKLYAIKAVDPKYFLAVMGCLSKQPTLFSLNERNRRRKLKGALRQKRISAQQAYKGLLNSGQLPEGLTLAIINNTISLRADGRDRVINMDRKYYDAIVHYARNQPDPFLLNADKRREYLVNLLTKKNKGSVAIYTELKDLGLAPEGMTQDTINLWTRARDEKFRESGINPDWYYLVIRHLKSLPDRPRVDLFQEGRLEKFLNELNRTGLRARKITALMNKDGKIPDYLIETDMIDLINKWAKWGEAPRQPTDATAFNAALECLKAQPTASAHFNARKKIQQPEVGT